ncbi:MAG: isochorismatase family cysteine hydrolase [Polyangiaceae bacterium]
MGRPSSSPPSPADFAETAEEEALAILSADVLTVRPDHVVQARYGAMPEDVREVHVATRELVAALAYAAEPVTPSPSLRDRLFATLASRRESKRALVVVDMINDHLGPGRALEVPRARAVVPALKCRIDDARASGVPVIYVLDRHDDDDADLDEWGAHAIDGTEGAEVWPELAPSPGDHVVHKPSYSAFFGSSLEPLLESLGVDAITLAGCVTELQLLTSATDAAQNGYLVDVPRDTQAGMTEGAEAAALAVIETVRPYAPARNALLQRVRAGQRL